MSRGWDTMKRIVWRLEEQNKPIVTLNDIKKAIHQEAGLSGYVVTKYRRLMQKYKMIYCDRWKKWHLGEKPQSKS